MSSGACVTSTRGAPFDFESGEGASDNLADYADLLVHPTVRQLLPSNWLNPCFWPAATVRRNMGCTCALGLDFRTGRWYQVELHRD